MEARGDGPAPPYRARAPNLRGAPAAPRVPSPEPSSITKHRPITANDPLVPLFRHAHLPHARERDKSAEVGVTHQPKVCDTSAEGLLGPVSRTCTRFWCSRRESNPEPWD